MLSGNDSPSSSRALVAIESDAHEPHARGPIQRASNFVTQLIASARQVPQARQRRRAEPAEVIAAYQATIARIRKLNNQ